MFTFTRQPRYGSCNTQLLLKFLSHTLTSSVGCWRIGKSFSSCSKPTSAYLFTVSTAKEDIPWSHRYDDHIIKSVSFVQVCPDYEHLISIGNLRFFQFYVSSLLEIQYHMRDLLSGSRFCSRGAACFRAAVDALRTPSSATPPTNPSSG